VRVPRPRTYRPANSAPLQFGRNATAGSVEWRTQAAGHAAPAIFSGGPDLPTLRRLWRDYSLTIVVGTFFIVSFVLHTIFGWWQYAADQMSQGQDPTLWGWSGYIIYFGEWTFQNWQSEFLEVLVLIVATAYFIHKGSHESKDGEDEMKAMLRRIEKRLDELETESRPKRKAS
jgi:hypothetical protein